MKYWILFGTSVFLGASGILTVALLYSLTGGDIPLDYGVTIDAGSSHTSFTLYKWKGDKYKGTGKAEQLDYCQMGNLTSMDPEKIEDKFRPCVTNVTRKLPNSSTFTTPIFLGATAGMRLLRESHPDRVEAIMIAARCALEKTGLSVKKVEIISGEEEGLFGWITTNFLYSVLQGSNEPNTFGAFDLGGASTQASFAVEGSNTSTFPLKLYGREYNVAAHSYLCYGANEIFRRYSALLIQNLDTEEPIYDPCIPKDYNNTWNAEDLLGSPCTETEVYEEWLFHHRHNKNITFTFVGTGDATKCLRSVTPLLKEEECRKNFTHCYKPLTVPTSSHKFAAFSTFYYTANFLNATNVNLTEYRALTEILCNMTWKEVQELPRKKVPEALLFRVCFEAMYIDLLLTSEGYGFNETTWENIQFVEQVNNTDVGWSLGYMINASNCIPAEFPTPASLNLTVTILLLIICVFILIISWFFLKKALWLRSTENSYLSV